MTPTATASAGTGVELPYVDEHAVRIAAPRALVWTALQRYVGESLLRADGHPFTRLLGTEPSPGFEVAESDLHQRLVLAGRHRFSRYMLAFELSDMRDGATLVRAQTYAAFPGPAGRLYRALVIGTRAHVVATNHMLRSIRRLSDDLAGGHEARRAWAV
jgi:hypothetical protein